MEGNRMALSYHFSISAPSSASPDELEQFLKRVEAQAKQMGFNPTMVLNAAFDTEERRKFARRITSGLLLEDPRLAGIVLPDEGQLWSHDPVHGACRVMPKRAVVVILTDSTGIEVCFGFLQYPEEILDIHGQVIATTGLLGRWIQRDFVDTADPRYRKLIRMFADSGFLESEKDEYA
jgi:hypothetical protein